MNQKLFRASVENKIFCVFMRADNKVCILTQTMIDKKNWKTSLYYEK